MTISTLHKRLLAVALTAGGLLLGGGAAQATPGTVFTGNDSLLFIPGTNVPGVGIGGFEQVTPTLLEWVELGGAEAHSFLRILDPTNTDVNIVSDSGVWVDIAQIEHENNIIPVSSFSFTIDMSNSFTLNNGTVFDLSGTDTLTAPTLTVNFTETPNATPCPAPNPLGSVCDDIFQVNNLDAVIGNFLFTALGERWVLTVRLLAEADEGTFFDDAGNIIFTAEGETSHLFIQAQINQVEIPEPGALALLAIGMAGLPLAFTRRSRSLPKKGEARKFV